MKKRMKSYRIILLMVVLLLSFINYAQQDPQFTQYMYNTMSVNPAYAGQRDVLSIVGLHRTQWVGIDGAPRTQTFSLHSPLRNESIGLGLNIINDQLGPVSETYFTANFSYTIPLDDRDLDLSFGIDAGGHLLTSDWSKGVQERLGDPTFADNLSLLSPMIGAGVYLHSYKWYLGLSVPNFITTRHYDDFQIALASERMHYYLIGGYVFDVSQDLKLKPAALVKAVSGAPIIFDVSLNALISEKFTLGGAYRWDDSFSGLLGFQVTNNIYIGYSYDLTTTGLSNYNSGTHEIMLRFELIKDGRILSPRFF